jgi:L-2-amino-thiazoline-4-carboxylic acid hydrolase
MAELPPDTLNEIGVLKRREIEARILMPVLEALGREFGRDKVFAVARDTVIEVAREQGRQGALGIAEVGALLSCNRDFSLIEGFNPDIELTRTQTIMQGASHCDFRFKLKKPAAAPRA